MIRWNLVCGSSVYRALGLPRMSFSNSVERCKAFRMGSTHGGVNRLGGLRPAPCDFLAGFNQRLLDAMVCGPWKQHERRQQDCGFNPRRGRLENFKTDPQAKRMTDIDSIRVGSDTATYHAHPSRLNLAKHGKCKSQHKTERVSHRQNRELKEDHEQSQNKQRPQPTCQAARSRQQSKGNYSRKKTRNKTKQGKQRNPIRLRQNVELRLRPGRHYA